jgi:hypothetical protein
MKIGIVKFEDCINAYPRAAPINGAVQGDATITAHTPVKNDPEMPLDPTTSISNHRRDFKHLNVFDRCCFINGYKHWLFDDKTWSCWI